MVGGEREFDVVEGLWGLTGRSDKRRLLTEGRGLVDNAPDQASRALSDALSLWQGPALAGIEQAFARDAAARLNELRLKCLELHIQAELTLGHHNDVVADLEALVARYPLRERLCAQLMVALYRSSRQADALARYRTLRRTLATELGVEPGPELRSLNQLYDEVVAAQASLAAARSVNKSELDAWPNGHRSASSLTVPDAAAERSLPIFARAIEQARSNVRR